MIAVTFALPAESSDFVRLLEKSTLNSREGVESVRGRLHGKDIAVLHTGVGEKSCRAQMESFLRRQRFEYLISAGFAGALEKDLRPGHLLIAENFSSAELLESPELNLAAAEIFLGKLLTVPGVINSNAERERLATATGAVAVDMETGFIAEACAHHTTPMLSLRVITDTPSEPFPVPPEILFDVRKQKTSFSRLAFYLATHPAAISGLKAFRTRITAARGSLTATLDQILRVDLL